MTTLPRLFRMFFVAVAAAQTYRALRDLRRRIRSTQLQHARRGLDNDPAASAGAIR
jgi:hypothetical protein